MGTALNAQWGIPWNLGIAGEAAGMSTQALSGTASKVAGIFMLDCDAQTLAISHAWFRQSAQTLTPGAASYMISLQTLDASGLPSGNDVATGSAVSAGTGTATSFQPVSGDTNVGRWIALSNAYTATRGDIICVVVEHIVVDASNFITVSYGNGEFTRTGTPYACTNTGSWAKVGSGYGLVLFAVKNSGGTVVCGFPGKTIRVSSDFGNTVETGFTFTIPTNFCSTYTVKGVRFKCTMPSTGTKVYAARLYSTPTGTVAAQQTATNLDGDVNSAVNGVDRDAEIMFNDSSLYTCSAGTKYAIAFNTTTAADMSLEYLEVGAAADFNAMPYQQNVSFASRTATFPPAGTTTAFTETTTRRPIAMLILGDITAPAGGSGGGIRIAGHGGLAA